MSTPSLGTQALSTAIHAEIRSRDLYREIAARITDRGGQRRLLRLAREEEGHRAALEARYRAAHGVEHVFDPAAPGGPVFDFVKSSVGTQAGALEVVSVAISAEKEAAAFYKAQQVEATDPEDVKLLAHLVGFENGHAERLQKEYRRLQKRFTWGKAAGAA
jgi:rubrerythrin